MRNLMENWQNVLKGSSSIDRRFLFFNIVQGEYPVPDELTSLVETVLKVSSERDREIYRLATIYKEISAICKAMPDVLFIHMQKTPQVLASAIERIMQKVSQLA